MAFSTNSVIQKIKSKVFMLERWIHRDEKSETKDFADLDGKENVWFLGNSATEILKNIAFNTAINRVEREYFKMWQNSKPLDVDGREAIWRGLQAISEIKLKLTGMVNEMIIKQKEYEEEQKLKGGK